MDAHNKLNDIAPKSLDSRVAITSSRFLDPFFSQDYDQADKDEENSEYDYEFSSSDDDNDNVNTNNNKKTRTKRAPEKDNDNDREDRSSESAIGGQQAHLNLPRLTSRQTQFKQSTALFDWVVSSLNEACCQYKEMIVVPLDFNHPFGNIAVIDYKWSEDECHMFRDYNKLPTEAYNSEIRDHHCITVRF
ncbi:hypothetical protein KCU78_g12921, partial [Aureobasidium melanogenum]